MLREDQVASMGGSLISSALTRYVGAGLEALHDILTVAVYGLPFFFWARNWRLGGYSRSLSQATVCLIFSICVMVS